MPEHLDSKRISSSGAHTGPTVRAIVTPSGFLPLPARGRICGERQPAPFPAPAKSKSETVPVQENRLHRLDLEAMQTIEGWEALPLHPVTGSDGYPIDCQVQGTGALS